MPLFQIKGSKLAVISKTNFEREKDLQEIVQENLRTVFNCRLVASEFSTGQNHAGRIDTLAISEENNPVIIEYKKAESSELINQGLFYLQWIYDHKGDFEIAVQKNVESNIKVDWSDVRVICIAPNFRKYDLHAVQVMGANIELWSYRLFENSTLYLEEVFSKSYESSGLEISSSSKKAALSPGKKAAITRATGAYTFDEHLRGKPKKIRNLALTIQEFMSNLDPSIKENPKKFYIAYKSSQNIVCVQIRSRKIKLFVKVVPESLKSLPQIARNVTNIGHYGTGDLEFTVKNQQELDVAKPYIEMAYRKMG